MHSISKYNIFYFVYHYKCFMTPFPTFRMYKQISTEKKLSEKYVKK